MEQRFEEQPTWRIVMEPPKEEDAPIRFAVLRGERRMAWGLRDGEAAVRWLKRLTAPAQSPLFA